MADIFDVLEKTAAAAAGLYSQKINADMQMGLGAQSLGAAQQQQLNNLTGTSTYAKWVAIAFIGLVGGLLLLKKVK